MKRRPRTVGRKEGEKDRECGRAGGRQKMEVVGVGGVQGECGRRDGGGR